MNIKELHAELSKQIESGNGELPVVLECDHGQTPMGVSWAGKSRVEDSTQYMMGWQHEGDPVYLIQAY